MKLPTWFKIAWWALITTGTGYIFHLRWATIDGGHEAPVDVFIFLVLVALLLVPIFNEVSFFGMGFKQAIDDLHRNINTQLASFKADIQTTISSSNTSNISVNIPSPPSDDKLPELEERIRKVVGDALGKQGVLEAKGATNPIQEVDGGTVFLFSTRYVIEKRLRRIAAAFPDLVAKRSPAPVAYIIMHLVKQEIMDANLGQVIREVYSVCSPAIHGETATDAQVNFVRDVAPRVIDTLAELEHKTVGSV